jgi:peptidoglycan/LPS O-acetylase OafA/YrhL
MLSYRHEIDGLRAIAALAVVLFHFHFPYLNGGFVGVDIFFVISGYLISGIVLKQIALSEFRFSTFLSGRIIRLFPALFVTIVCTFTAGLFLFSPSLMQELAEAAIFSTFVRHQRLMD